MRNVSVLLAIAFLLFVMGFVVNFDEILRLHDGQVQVMEKGEWRCADAEVGRAVLFSAVELGDTAVESGVTDDTTDRGVITVAAIESVTYTPPDITYSHSTKLLTISDPNEVKVEDDFIRHLAESGRVCEVMGHQWQYYYIEGPDDGQKCALCGKTRIKKWGEE